MASYCPPRASYTGPSNTSAHTPSDHKFQANGPSAYGNYSTALIGNFSVAWIRKVGGALAAAQKGEWEATGNGSSPGRPFFAYIAPKAAHDPFQPAVWYKDFWAPDWPARSSVSTLKQ